jgi:uncharacterized protein YegL
MPRMMDNSMETGQVGQGRQAFQFSGVRVDSLGATEYTLVTVAVDVTGSVGGFADELRNCLILAVESCKKSPRANNLLVRVVLFSSSLPKGVEEVHGFKPLGEIDTNSYQQFNPYGATPLFDATFSAVGATNAYAKKLKDQDFLVNGIVFIVTDGDDNCSVSSVRMIENEMKRGAVGEDIESLVGVVVGINAGNVRHLLDNFATGAGLQYIDAGDATKGKLAKLAQFVSQSVSSQSQALGTGGPSQNIAVTI